VVIEALNNGADSYLQKGGKSVPQYAELKHRIQVVVQRHRGEEALRESEERYRTILDQAADGVILHDETGHIVDVNRKTCQSLGYSREELLSKSIEDIDPDAILEGKSNLWNAVLAGESYTFESHHVHKDGSTIPVEVALGPLHLPLGPAILGIVRDITERKLAEDALQEASRKLNLLSSITRHDIKNQLMALTGNLTLLEKKQFEHSSDEHLLKAEAAAERISAMIQFTKEYEDIGVHAPIWQDVRALVDECTKDVPSGPIKVVNDVPVDTEVFADPLIVKVFHNLIHNAVRHGGNITAFHFFVEELEGARAIICEDDGVGISADMKEKLFTRGSGKDHGFGLFLSREILSITGITIAEAGAPGRGARFVTTVPQSGLKGT